MVKITTHKNIKTKISKISETKVMTSSHYLLLVLSVAAIMITYTSFTSSINTAQAQTANQSTSSTPPSNASSNLGNVTNLSDAVTIAQKAVSTNTSATSAFIRSLNGYLVYDVHVRNNSNNTTAAYSGCRKWKSSL